MGQKPTTPARPTPARPTPARPTPARPTPERPTPERPTPERPTPERPTPARPTGTYPNSYSRPQVVNTPIPMPFHQQGYKENVHSTPGFSDKKDNSNSTSSPTVMSGSTVHSTSVGNSTGSSQSEIHRRTVSTYTTSGVPNQRPATPAYEHVRAIETQQQKLQSSTCAGTPFRTKPAVTNIDNAENNDLFTDTSKSSVCRSPVVLKSAIQTQKQSVSHIFDNDSDELFINTSKPLAKVDNCTHTKEEQANLNGKVQCEARKTDLDAKCSKEINVVEHQKQRTRRPRKPRLTKNQNFRPRIRNDSNAAECRMGGNKNRFINTTEFHSTNNTMSNEFNEKIFIENAIVVAGMLECVNLETLSNTSKMLLKRLHYKLYCLNDKISYDTQDQTFILDNHDENEAEVPKQELEPADIFESLYPVGTRHPTDECHGTTEDEDDDGGDVLDEVKEDSRNNTNSNIQHVFGAIYYCVACEQDLHGESAAASHVCKGECSLVTSDVKSESDLSDIIPAVKKSDVQQMWREVNRAQKGRWYNISHVKDGVFHCTTCDVNLESTDHVIEHVRERDHLELLQQRRAEETKEDRIWREVPRALKYNRKHFILLNTEGTEGFVCKVCMSEVPFSFSQLMSHLTADSHVQEVRRKK